MKSVLISIQPKWCELIANGGKTIEVRKTKPKIETPFKCYIYCTKNKRQFLRKLVTTCKEIFLTENRDVLGRTEKVLNLIGGVASFCENGGYNGKVIGEFECDYIRWRSGVNFVVKEDAEATLKGTCLTEEEIYNYLGVKSGMSRYDKKTEFYCWHISDLVIYDKPKELGEYIVERYPCLARLKRPPQSWCYVESTEKGGVQE